MSVSQICGGTRYICHWPSDIPVLWGGEALGADRRIIYRLHELCHRWHCPGTFSDPHCAVMAANDFNRRQSIFLSFRFILSNTARLAPFPYGDTRVQGSAKARHVPKMTAQADLDKLSRSVHAHTIMRLTANNDAGEDAFTLNTLIAPWINEYWLPSVVVIKGACQSRASAIGTVRTLQSSIILVYLCTVFMVEPSW